MIKNRQGRSPYPFTFDSERLHILTVNFDNSLLQSLFGMFRGVARFGPVLSREFGSP